MAEVDASNIRGDFNPPLLPPRDAYPSTAYWREITKGSIAVMLSEVLIHQIVHLCLQIPQPTSFFPIRVNTKLPWAFKRCPNAGRNQNRDLTAQSCWTLSKYYTQIWHTQPLHSNENTWQCLRCRYRIRECGGAPTVSCTLICICINASDHEVCLYADDILIYLRTLSLFKSRSCQKHLVNI